MSAAGFAVMILGSMTIGILGANMQVHGFGSISIALVVVPLTVVLIVVSYNMLLAATT